MSDLLDDYRDGYGNLSFDGAVPSDDAMAMAREIESLRAEVKRLEDIIQNAPHAHNCRLLQDYGPIAGVAFCDCWKIDLESNNE